MTNWLSGGLLVAWLLLEVVLRSGDDARDWHGGKADRSSTRLIVVTYVVAFVGPFLLDTSGVGLTATDSTLAWIGIAVGVAGLMVRIWSMRVLGQDYTRSLRTRETQSVVDSGRTDSRATPDTSDRFSYGWEADLLSTGWSPR